MCVCVCGECTMWMCEGLCIKCVLYVYMYVCMVYVYVHSVCV